MKINVIGTTIVFLAGASLAMAQGNVSGSGDVVPAAVGQEQSGAAGSGVAKRPPQPSVINPYINLASCEKGGDCGHGCGTGCDAKPYNCNDETPYSLNSRLYGNVEFIIWWQKIAQVPTLLQTGAAPAIGKDQTDFGGRSGARATIGMFVDPTQDCGFEATYLFLGKDSANLTAASDQNGFPAIPQSRTITLFDRQGVPSLLNVPVSSPGNFAGFATQVSDTSAWGIEANARVRTCSFLSDRTYLLTGFRHFQLNEGVRVFDDSTVLPTNTNPLLFQGDRIRANDNFFASNQFYGAQLGVASEFYWGRCSLDLTGKCALGAVHEAARITGTTVYAPVGGAPTVTPQGALTSPASIGDRSRDIFAWLPEVTANVGYHFTPNVKGYVGYNYMFLSNAIRAGNLTGATFTFNPTNYFAQGFNVGVQVRY